MAKALQVLLPASDADPQKWLANVLKLRFQEVLDHREAALDTDDIEGVHDMRVAIRRLRSILGDFAVVFDSAPVKRVRKSLKRLADLLGVVRDRDVYLEALEKFRSDATSVRIRESISKLIGENRLTRDHAFADLAANLAEDRLNEIVEHFAEVVESALARPGLFQPPSLRAAAREVISARLKDLTRRGSDIYDPSDEDGLHDIRIAAKKLRYAIELFVPILGEDSKSFAITAAELQSLLGDVHDCDVWIGGLTDNLKKTKVVGAVTRPDREAMSWILSELVKKRSNRYRSALELWNRLETNYYAETLWAAIAKS